jgi:molybdenum cofactor cytidylyltransferase
MKLALAFGVTRGEVVSLVGAGGKSTTLAALGHELAAQGWRVVATTTTRVGLAQLDWFPRAMNSATEAQRLSAALTEDHFVFVYDHIAGEKVMGVDLSWVSWALDALDADILLIEADGARRLPFKAPHSHEPVIVPETTLVVPVAHLAALGQPLDDDHVYNAAAMIARYGFPEGAPVKSPWVAQVLRDPTLGLKNVPENARVVGWLNGVPATGYLRGRARLIARLMLREPKVYAVALGDAAAPEPVCEVQRRVGAIVLAGGLSRRMGEPKVLLPWAEGRSILAHILEQIRLAKVDEITVVTGHHADQVAAVAAGCGAAAVHNPDYATGEMLSSLKAGLRAQPASIAAALIVLGDQPRVQPRVIGKLLAAYFEGRGEIVVPSYQMRRGHPILVDRRYWQEILALPPEGAPRDVINAYADRIAYVEVDTDSLLRDVDTPDDYRDERQRAGLSPA